MSSLNLRKVNKFRLIEKFRTAQSTAVDPALCACRPRPPRPDADQEAGAGPAPPPPVPTALPPAASPCPSAPRCGQLWSLVLSLAAHGLSLSLPTCPSVTSTGQPHGSPPLGSGVAGVSRDSIAILRVCRGPGDSASCQAHDVAGHLTVVI